MVTIEELEQKIAKLEEENKELCRTVKLLNWRIIRGLENSCTEINWKSFDEYRSGRRDSEFKE